MLYRLRIVLTDHRWPGGHRSDPCRGRGQEAAKGTRFVDRTPVNEEAEAAAEVYWTARGEPRVWLVQAFHACGQHGIEHRTTKPAHSLGDRRVAVPGGHGSRALPSMDDG